MRIKSFPVVLSVSILILTSELTPTSSEASISAQSGRSRAMRRRAVGVANEQETKSVCGFGGIPRPFWP